MFDSIPSNVFWPLFAFFWLLASAAATWLFAKLVDRMNPRNQRGEWRHMASIDQVRQESRQ